MLNAPFRLTGDRYPDADPTEVRIGQADRHDFVAERRPAMLTVARTENQRCRRS